MLKKELVVTSLIVMGAFFSACKSGGGEPMGGGGGGGPMNPGQGRCAQCGERPGREEGLLNEGAGNVSAGGNNIDADGANLAGGFGGTADPTPNGAIDIPVPTGNGNVEPQEPILQERAATPNGGDTVPVTPQPTDNPQPESVIGASNPEGIETIDPGTSQTGQTLPPRRSTE